MLDVGRGISTNAGVESFHLPLIESDLIRQTFCGAGLGVSRTEFFDMRGRGNLPRHRLQFYWPLEITIAYVDLLYREHHSHGVRTAIQRGWHEGGILSQSTLEIVEQLAIARRLHDSG